MILLILKKRFRLKIIRPLLNYHKKQLLDYAIEYHLNYRKDKSNDLPITARNRLRNELLPLLCDIFNQSSDNFTLAKKVNRLWEDYRQLYERAINQIELTDFLDPQGRLFLPQWQEQNNLIKEHLIFQFLKKNKISNINQKMVHSCIQIASSKEQNLSTVNLPGNKYFKRREKRGIIV